MKYLGTKKGVTKKSNVTYFGAKQFEEKLDQLRELTEGEIPLSREPILKWALKELEKSHEMRKRSIAAFTDDSEIFEFPTLDKIPEAFRCPVGPGDYYHADGRVSEIQKDGTLKPKRIWNIFHVIGYTILSMMCSALAIAGLLGLTTKNILAVYFGSSAAILFLFIAFFHKGKLNE